MRPPGHAGERGCIAVFFTAAEWLDSVGCMRKLAPADAWPAVPAVLERLPGAGASEICSLGEVQNRLVSADTQNRQRRGIGAFAPAVGEGRSVRDQRSASLACSVEAGVQQATKRNFNYNTLAQQGGDRETSGRRPRQPQSWKRSGAGRNGKLFDGSSYRCSSLIGGLAQARSGWAAGNATGSGRCRASVLNLQADLQPFLGSYRRRAGPGRRIGADLDRSSGCLLNVDLTHRQHQPEKPGFLWSVVWARR